MIALLTLYDKSDHLHVLTWDVEVDDLAMAVRVVAQLHRRHVRTECAQCTITHYTVTGKEQGRPLFRILEAGAIGEIETAQTRASSATVVTANNVGSRADG